VRALRPFGEADDVAPAQLVLALGVAERRSTGDDEQPFLVPVLVVVGEGALARLSSYRLAPSLTPPIRSPTEARRHEKPG